MKKAKHPNKVKTFRTKLDMTQRALSARPSSLAVTRAVIAESRYCPPAAAARIA
jgi:hypothetical protein